MSDLIERHVKEAHKAKRGLRGHFTATEYDENWRTLHLLLDEIERLTQMIVDLEGLNGVQAQVENRLNAEIECLRGALERIANKPPLNEEYGNQGIDADEMMGIASEALNEGS